VNLFRLVLVFALTVGFADNLRECAHDVVTQLDRRFSLIENAAKWKWNHGMKVRDDTRRASLHYLILKMANAKGYEEKWNDDVIDLLLGQAERYQKHLYYNWRREGISLFHKPPNIRTVTDPQLDRLTEELIDLLNAKKDLIKSPGMLAEMIVFCNKLPESRKYFIAPIIGYLAPGRRPPAEGVKIDCPIGSEIAVSGRIDSL